MWRIAHDDGFDSLAQIDRCWSVDDIFDACEVMDLLSDVSDWRRPSRHAAPKTNADIVARFTDTSAR